MKKIPLRYFNELKKDGTTVPRNEKTGEVISFIVSKIYNISNDKNKEIIKAICTQNCPYHLKTIL